MKTSRIYTDTSVIGGCLDDEFKSFSIGLFDKFRSGEAIFVVSNLTLLELENAPESVRAIMTSVPVSYRELVNFSEEAAELAELYAVEGVLSKKHRIDAQHIAIATVSRVDVLVSWNFKHIVNLRRVRGFNAVNLKYGYATLEIRTPREVITYDED